MLADRRRRVDPDLYLGLAIDCSGSMEGSKMERARLAGTLLAEACRGLPGVELGIIGFTDDTIYLAGNADQCAVHALEAGGGNNDAAALAHAAAAARESRRRSKLLLMISDGFPTECSVKSLEHLVASLTKEGIRCAQVAVGPLETVSFPHHVVFTDSDPGVAIPAFGRAVANLVSQTLRSMS
jgi:Mg-chelatase subunit ChlD